MPRSARPLGPVGHGPVTGRGRTRPVLVRQVRNGIEESVHRGDIVEADADRSAIRSLGDPDRVVTLRSTVKPFGVVALIEAGGIEAFDLEPPEIAIMASSHSGEDFHVRTLQGMFRRAGVSQALLACGNEGMPLDALTAARLARDGEKAGPIRHMCSGQHAVSLLLSRLKGWDLETYWRAGPPVAGRLSGGGRAGVRHDAGPARRRRSTAAASRPTRSALREVAQAYAFLADPRRVGQRDPRSSLAPAADDRPRRDASRNPEMVGGRHDRLDTSLMKARRGSAHQQGRHGGAPRRSRSCPGRAPARCSTRRPGLAIKIEDGDGYDRGTWAASVEALRQVGVLDGQALRVLARYHRPTILDPHGRVGAESIPEFELAPVGELIG